MADTATTADLDTFLKEQDVGMNKLLASQRAESDKLYGQYNAAVKGQEKLGNAFTRLSSEAGVPELSKTISGFKSQIANVQNMINQLNDNITERTKGSFTTEAQRQRQVAAEQTPLTKQLGELGTAMQPYSEQLTSAQQLIATRLGLLSQDQQKELQPLIMKIDSLSDRFAREITGYSQSKTMQFNSLLAKVQQGWKLQEMEIAQANQLALEEQQYQHQKELAAQQYTYDIRKIGASSAASNPSQSDYNNSLRAEIGNAIANDINIDPNSPEGAQTFRSLYAKYGGYGFSMDQIKKIAADIWSGR